MHYYTEKRSIKMMQEVIDYIKVNNKCPPAYGKTITLGSWISSIRCGTECMYPSIANMAKEHNIEYIFDAIDFKQRALDNCQKVIDFFYDNLRYPSNYNKC